MSNDCTDRLREIVRVASDTWGLGRVTLHLRRAPGSVLELRASSHEEPRSASDGPLRAEASLVARVLGSDSPVVVTSESLPHRLRVMARVEGWDGDPRGILTFELNRTSASPEPPDRATVQWAGSLAALIGQAVAAVDRAQELARREASLTARAAVEQRLTEVSQDGGGLAALVRECASLTGKGVTLFDHDERPITSAFVGETTAVRCPGIREILAGRSSADTPTTDPTEAFVVAAGGGSGLSRRKIVAPVIVDGELFGWLVLDEHPSGFTPLDRFVAQRAAARAGAELLIQRRVARMAWNAKSALARSMVRGTQSAKDLMASAEYLGVDTHARRVLAYVLDPASARAASLDEDLADEVQRLLGVEVLATRGSEGFLLIVEAPADGATASIVHDVKVALGSATKRLCGPETIVGVSTVCEPTSLSRGYREAREVVHCIDRFAGRSTSRVLAVDDLGPARLFLANSDTSAIRGYVTDVLGPLLSGEPAMSVLLSTLQCYFAASRSVRTSAAQLGVHENTIRLRLARVAAATGLDVAGDANDQLSVQTALLVLRLQGHPALMDVAVPDADPRRLVPADQGDRPTSPQHTERQTA